MWLIIPVDWKLRLLNKTWKANLEETVSTRTLSSSGFIIVRHMYVYEQGIGRGISEINKKPKQNCVYCINND